MLEKMDGYSIALDNGVLTVRHPHGNPKSKLLLIISNRLLQVGCRQLWCDTRKLRHDSRFHNPVFSESGQLRRGCDCGSSRRDPFEELICHVTPVPLNLFALRLPSYPIP